MWTVLDNLRISQDIYLLYTYDNNTFMALYGGQRDNLLDSNWYYYLIVHFALK